MFAMAFAAISPIATALGYGVLMLALLVCSFWALALVTEKMIAAEETAPARPLRSARAMKKRRAKLLRATVEEITAGIEEVSALPPFRTYGPITDLRAHAAWEATKGSLEAQLRALDAQADTLTRSLAGKTQERMKRLEEARKDARDAVDARQQRDLALEMELGK